MLNLHGGASGSAPRDARLYKGESPVWEWTSLEHRDGEYYRVIQVIHLLRGRGGSS